MNILILGSGGREHAFAWKMAQSPLCSHLFVAPGNAGTTQVATNLDIKVTDFEAIETCIQTNDIEMVVVGPEDPLVQGIRDFLVSKFPNLIIVGPDAKGAQLEGSKDFTKEFLQRHKVPTATSKTFTDENFDEGISYIRSHPLPIVLKADGLAAGKGVIIAETQEDALIEYTKMIKENKFGAASSKVVIEQFLKGIELSVFILCDGENYVILPEAKDYKRIGEGDTGLNTGGMGAISPVPFAKGSFLEKVEEKVIKPTVAGLKKDDIDYHGFLFIGLMNVNGEPFVIEFNVRMGDPETEAVLTRIDSDLVELFKAMGEQKLDSFDIKIDENYATTVVLVSEGYPEAYQKGKAITGIEAFDDVVVFHSGTKEENGQILSNGGRVMALTGRGVDMKSSLANANKAAETIQWDGKNYRQDIGFDLK